MTVKLSKSAEILLHTYFTIFRTHKCCSVLSLEMTTYMLTNSLTRKIRGRQHQLEKLEVLYNFDRRKKHYCGCNHYGVNKSMIHFIKKNYMIKGVVSRPVLQWVWKFLIQVIKTLSKWQKLPYMYVWDTDTVINGAVRWLKAITLKVVLNLRSKNPSFKILPVLNNAPGNPQDSGLTDLSI
jgi:hypothetical protein